MKTKNLLGFLVASLLFFNVQAQFNGAPYIITNPFDTLISDSVYFINKASNTTEFTVDGKATEADWNGKAFNRVLNHLMMVHDGTFNQTYPQTETDLKATFKALWVDNDVNAGMYMFISVVDDLVRYQNPDYQWENDAIELYFANKIGDGKIQIIIPAMVGTPHPDKPAAQTTETGSGVGSDPSYKVFGYNSENYSIDNFKWAIVKTDAGYDMEIFFDKDVVTQGASETYFGLNKMFAGDINIDEADEKQNTNTPALYVRDCSLGLLGFSNQEYANSNYYGYFKLVDSIPGVIPSAIAAVNNTNQTIAYINSSNQLVLKNAAVNANVAIYNIAGQLQLQTVNTNNHINVANLNAGMYFVTVNNKSYKVIKR